MLYVANFVDFTRGLDWRYGAPLVALFSLLFFVMGVLLGRCLGAPAKGTRGRTKAGAPRGKNRGEGSSEVYVGNLSYDISEKELKKIFERFGPVASMRLIGNKANGKSKGYGFIEMESRSSAMAAIKGLNGKEVKGRSIVVNEARSRARR